MKRSYYAILAIVVAFIAMTFVLRTFTQPLGGPPPQEQEQQAESSAAPVSASNATKAITVSPAEQARDGIRVAVLAATSAQQRISAPAVVLSAQSLATSSDAYVAAQAKLQKAQVDLGVTQKELARVTTLYQDNQNVSEKDFEFAQGAVRSDEIDLRAARLQLSLQSSIVRQKWGGTVAKWVENASPTLDRVLAQQDLLVDVSLSDGQTTPPPSTVWLALPGGKQTSATFVSSLPQVDPRVQGVSLLYLAPARMGLAPGVTLVAQLPVGHRTRGVVVPASAIVWSGGQAWVYVQTASDSFVRHPISPDFPMNGGYFVNHGFAPGEKIAVAGAQILLSAELSPAGSSSGESDEDDDD